jgi:transaldolase
MAKTISFTIKNDTKAAKFLDYFCLRYGYRDQVENPDFDSTIEEDPTTNPSMIDNPITKAEFLRTKTIDWWRGEAYAGMMKEQDALARAEFNTDQLTIN